MNSRNSTGRGILANSSSNNACSEIRSHGSDTVSPQPNALGAFDNALEKNHRRSVGTSATVMTSGSDESSHLSDAGDTNNQRKTRRRYRRSLTDQGYNRFLDFLESSRSSISSEGSISTLDSTEDGHKYKLFLEFLASPGCGSSSQVCSSGETISNLDLVLPTLQTTGSDQLDDCVSIDLEVDGCNNTNKMWTDDCSASDHERISLSDSSLSDSDSSSILSLMVDEWQGRVMGSELKITSLISTKA